MIISQLSGPKIIRNIIFLMASNLMAFARFEGLRIDLGSSCILLITDDLFLVFCSPCAKSEDPTLYFLLRFFFFSDTFGFLVLILLILDLLQALLRGSLRAATIFNITISGSNSNNLILRVSFNLSGSSVSSLSLLDKKCQSS